jgi:hypothetical protein
MTTPQRGAGFYRWRGGDLEYGERVYGPGYTLTLDEPPTVLPVDGWDYYADEAAAMAARPLPPTALSTRSQAMFVDLQKIADTTGTMSLLQLTTSVRTLARVLIVALRYAISRIDAGGGI